MRLAATLVAAVSMFLFVDLSVAHRDHTAKEKLTERQVRKELTKAKQYVSWIKHSKMGRWARAFRHPTCFTVPSRKHRGLCFYTRNRLRWHVKRIDYLARLLPPVLPPHYNEWLCIHGYEGAWNANTGNGYWGGLQMDWSFMQSYGGYLLRSKGTADKWTPLEQMWVAERAYASGRGFNPWPNTARMCGLL